MAVFGRQGYEGASLVDLTQAMGITAPSLYAAFESKAALYRRCLAHYRAGAGAFTQRALTGEGTTRECFARVLRDSAAHFVRDQALRGCLISTAALTCAAENQAVVEHTASLRADALAQFEARIERGLAEGDVPAGTDTKMLARYIGAVLQGMSVQAQDGAPEAELLQVAALAMRAWDGLSRP
ncbi:TetR/AcrR family transcriptional regulator [Citreicoccus inhibens]|uniref:TetR/AcrR family transcriptional regulator n=1 Tax=Citreicoccus inhibens TaxID=2849499 RepID=UPI001EF0B205|nr:TetR/AcrR family transcriptional regulator [Citreicoccus inhibens]